MLRALTFTASQGASGRQPVAALQPGPALRRKRVDSRPSERSGVRGDQRRVVAQDRLARRLCTTAGLPATRRSSAIPSWKRCPMPPKAARCPDPGLHAWRREAPCMVWPVRLCFVSMVAMIRNQTSSATLEYFRHDGGYYIGSNGDAGALHAKREASAWHESGLAALGLKPGAGVVAGIRQAAAGSCAGDGASAGVLLSVEF